MLCVINCFLAAGGNVLHQSTSYLCGAGTHRHFNMTDANVKQKVIVVGAGPVGSLAAIYAAVRGDDVEIYELRGGEMPR